MDEEKCKKCKNHATFNYGLTDVMWCTKTTNLFPFSMIELVHQCPGFEPLQSGKATEEGAWQVIPEGNGLWTVGKLVTEGETLYYELATDMDGQKCVYKNREEAEKLCTAMLAVDKALRMGNCE